MNFKKMLSLVLVVVMCLSIFSGCGENEGNELSTTTEITAQNTRKTIVMVGENESFGFFKNLKKGAEEAAKKYGYTLEYMGAQEDAENIVGAHISSLENVIENDVSGVVIVPNGEGYSEIYSKLYDAEIPVVQIDDLTEDDFEKIEGNKKNPVISMVSTSYREAGALCAEKLFEEIKEDIKKSEETFVIGAIQGEESISDEEKTVGFVEKFSELADADSEIKDKYKIEVTSEGTVENSFSELEDDKVKAVFITHPSIADKISDIVSADAERYKNIVFCGFDSGAKQLKWLEKENIAKFIGGVAQDSYNLGYNAVEQCIFSVQGKEVKSEIKIEAKWYDKTNFDKMKQDEIIFVK